MGNTVKEFNVGPSIHNVLERISDYCIHRMYELSSSDSEEKSIRLDEISKVYKWIDGIDYIEGSMDLTYDEVMWLAGIFSSGGSIGVQGKLKIPKVSFRSKDYTLVAKIGELLKVKLYTLSDSNVYGSSRYRVVLSGSNAIRFMKLIYPLTFGETYSKIGLLLTEQQKS